MKTFSFTELTEMTVADLRSLASDLQIPGRSKATRKADLISLILAFQTEASVVEIEPTPAPVNTELPMSQTHRKLRMICDGLASPAPASVFMSVWNKFITPDPP